MNLTANEVSELSGKIEEKNLSSEEMKGNTQKAEETLELDEEIINLVVNYDRNVEEVIEAGKYVWVNSDITEKYLSMQDQLKGKIDNIKGKIFHVSKYYVEVEDVISEMDKAGYRPANIFELMALGESYPELQLQFVIVALGSVWSNGSCRYVAKLDDDDYGRRISAYSLHIGFLTSTRFFGVRK